MTLPRNKAVLYRFFIGKQISTQDIANNDLPVNVEVLWWETNVQPRQFNTQGKYSSKNVCLHTATKAASSNKLCVLYLQSNSL